jgi:hypothetical protein
MAAGFSIATTRPIHVSVVRVASYKDCATPKRRADGSIIQEAAAQMKYLPLGDQLAMMIAHDETREQLLYRARYVSDGETYRDVFDGDAYKALVRQGLFQGELDMALVLFVDGFNPFSGSQHTMTIVHIVVLNLDPSMR